MQQVKEDIDAAGHGTGVQRMKIIGHLRSEADALLLSRLCDLVADGIHDDARMVIILLHHGLQIGLPLLLEVARVVILGLVDIPHVDKLVQYEHAEAVARLQRRLGAGVVCRADGVVARLLQQLHLARIGERVVDRAQNAIVVVDTCAAQDDALAVDAESVRRVAHHLADAEGLLAHILAEGHAAGVEVGG